MKLRTAPEILKNYWKLRRNSVPVEIIMKRDL